MGWHEMNTGVATALKIVNMHLQQSLIEAMGRADQSSLDPQMCNLHICAAIANHMLSL